MPCAGGELVEPQDVRADGAAVRIVVEVRGLGVREQAHAATFWRHPIGARPRGARGRPACLDPNFATGDRAGA